MQPLNTFRSVISPSLNEIVVPLILLHANLSYPQHKCRLDATRMMEKPPLFGESFGSSIAVKMLGAYKAPTTLATKILWKLVSKNVQVEPIALSSATSRAPRLAGHLGRTSNILPVLNLMTPTITQLSC
ncbi:unnamed protein product [Penicillium discolor]